MSLAAARTANTDGKHAALLYTLHNNEVKCLKGPSDPFWKKAGVKNDLFLYLKPSCRATASVISMRHAGDNNNNSGVVISHRK